MAHILVVDDGPTVRERLHELLERGGHRSTEAANGIDGLLIAGRDRPDLVITDILLPTMDGYEFVQRLRADPEVGPTPVIFHSSTYRMAEAQSMASSCGVTTVLPKPSNARSILEAVNRELGLPPADLGGGAVDGWDTAAAVSGDEDEPLDRAADAYFKNLRAAREEIGAIIEQSERLLRDRRRLKPLSEELSRNLGAVEEAMSGLAALDRLSLRLTSERDAALMVQTFVDSASRIVGAKRALVVLLDSQEAKIAHLGVKDVDPAPFRSRALDPSELPGSLLKATDPVRVDSAPGDLMAIWGLVGVRNLLGVPVRSSQRTLGWICFMDRVGSHTFSAHDATLARCLAIRLAVACERTELYETVQRHASKLQIALHQQTLSAAEMVRMNRALKMLSASNQALIRMTDEESLLHEICQVAVLVGGYGIARVGYAMDDPEQSIEVKAYAGELPEFLKQPLSWSADRPEGQGPAGRAIRSGVVQIGEFAGEGPAETGEKPGGTKVGRAVCLPLKDGDRVFGVLGLSSAGGVAVGADELRLLLELAADLSFGVGTLRARRKQEKAEADRQDSLREQAALLKEVHHRVNNNLQVVISLLRLETKRAGDPRTIEVLNSMQNRLHSMAAFHETQHRSGNLARVDLADYLRALGRRLARSAETSSLEHVTLRFDLTHLGLDLESAIPCGLIVNELLSNALRHAFPGGRPGTVLLALRQQGDSEIVLEVSDDGVGLPEDLRARRESTLGLQLVEDLAAQLRGRLEIGPGPGARFEVRFRPGSSRAIGKFGPSNS